MCFLSLLFQGGLFFIAVFFTKMVKIFIGNLTEESDPIALRGLFEQFGKVSECDVLGKFGFVVSALQMLSFRFKYS